MEQSMPLVTIVALCYNHSRFVAETLQSIRTQAYPNIEVIVIDDCSKDDSIIIIEKWLLQNQFNWKFIKHNRNKGVSKSLNEGVDLARGKYFKAIACDDVLLPEFISTMVSRFEKLTEEYALIYSDVITINDQSEIFGQTPFAERGWVKDQDVPSGNLFVKLAENCFIPAPGTILRTNILQQLRFDETLYFEDWDLWLRIARQYLISGIAKPGVKYRIHSNSMFQQKSPAFIEAALLTAKKNMRYNKDADRYFKKFIIEWSLKNYFKNGARQTYWFWLRFLYAKTTSNFYKVVRSALGIRYKKNEK